MCEFCGFDTMACPQMLGAKTVTIDKKTELASIAVRLAELAGMPYCWEDVLNRLKNGTALPFKLNA